MKKVNETVWKGILDRGRGDDKRKEDKISENLLNALSAYIEIFASIEYTHDYTVGSYPEFKAFIKDYKDKPRVSSIDYNMEDLLNYTKEHWDDTVLPAIEDAIDNLNKQIDDIVDDLKNQDVNESTWGGILDRGSGEIVRKEDDVNLLDRDGLYDYIKSKYKKRIFYLDKYTGKFNLWEICVDIIGNISLKAIYNEDGEIDHIVLSWSGVGVKIRHSFLWALSEKFNVESVGIYRRVIKEKDDTCTNKTYIDIIEFFLNNKDNMLVNESTWGGMLDRGSGDSVRKEDDLTLDDIKYDIRSFVERVVYYEQYKNILYDFERFCKERWNFIDKKAKEYVEKKVDFAKRCWGKVKSAINDEINSENEKIKKIGFEKQPGKTIDDTLDTWWVDSLDGQERWDVLYSRGCEDNYVNPSDMWGDLTWEEKMTEYVAWQPTNESVWKDMLDKGTGEKTKKEDDVLNETDKYLLKGVIDMYKNAIYNKRYGNTLDGFVEYITRRKEDHLIAFGGDPIEDEAYDKVIKYVQDNWGDCGGIVEFRKKVDDIINESTWGGMLDRGTGEKIKKEDELSREDMDNLEQFLVFYATRIVYDDYEFSLDGLCDYIESNDREGVVSQDANIEGILNYVKNYWADELSDRLSGYVEMEEAERQKNITNECEGVPGGVTPASVGGMGAAYFPGPDGTPGSGDLPSPTGIVYHQVAPYTMFLKQIKKKKKKSKKFRKEDEPCVHSPNAKVYDYVDDFREYVDRTYNQMDRR